MLKHTFTKITKIVLLSFFCTLSSIAHASFECAGETWSGFIVRVQINTVGTRGKIQSGKVLVKTKKSGEEKSYDLKRDEISQAFEWTDTKDAIVGLTAYQAGNNPVTIKYSGKNFEGDLVKTLLETEKRTKLPNVEMRVWKGPGFEPGIQFQFTDVVCNVLIDP